jgi:hypothetical protein
VKATIYASLAPERVYAVLPPEYRKLVNVSDFGPGEHTVVQFPPERGGVVRSRALTKAFHRATGEAPIVVFGPNFTAEARELLASAGVPVYSIGEFYWTDASYTAIRAR